MGQGPGEESLGGVSHEVRRGAQGASRVAPGKSGLHARGEAERVLALESREGTRDILECEVKWALESITTNKASGGDGIPVELFKILKDDAVKVLHSICQQIWKTQQWPQDRKRSVFIPIPPKARGEGDDRG